MPGQETAAIWTEDMDEEETQELREWAGSRFDIHREYDEHATLLSEAESGDFTVLVAKSDRSLGPDTLKKLKGFGVRLQVWQDTGKR